MNERANIECWGVGFEIWSTAFLLKCEGRIVMIYQAAECGRVVGVPGHANKPVKERAKHAKTPRLQ